MAYFFLRDYFATIKAQVIGTNKIPNPDDSEQLKPTSASNSESKTTDNNSIGGFDKNKLLEMCNFCSISYGSNDPELSKAGYKTKAELINKGYNIIPFYYDDGRHAGFVFTQQDSREITIAYHGTKDFSDVITDLNIFFAIPAFLQNGERAHRGFYKAFLSSFESLDSVLKNHAKEQLLKIQDFKINFTGHSMGGAIAKIAALCFKKVENVQDIHVATFGDPRVFDLIASTTYNCAIGKSTIRVAQHWQDPVTASPPIWLGYSHVGEQLRVSKVTNIHKISDYRNATYGMEEKNFKPNNCISPHHYLAGMLHLINCAFLGSVHYILHYTIGTYFFSELELALSRKAMQKPNQSLSSTHCTQASAHTKSYK